MNSKQRYVAPKIEMLLIVLENSFDNFIKTRACDEARYIQPEKSKVSNL